ncbi:hypothetical protein NUW58_g436 [Xylaria curta]|uniref:Uncharacterized protein n=1 Tax=Xylaria curta TaxID=42375 RepID=A0ACC1PS07_9PEZI|nr:hypothetical protein NUW58_g436 [Xylaria curta]
MSFQWSTNSRTAEKTVPEWSSKATETTTGTNVVHLLHAEPMEFILSSNWVLLARGVESFYKSLYEREKNLEIVYDPKLHGFRVKCLSSDEASLVTLIRDTLNELVQLEIEKGIETSAKIISLENWRTKNSQSCGNITVSDKYAFPRDVAACNARDTWTISKEWLNNGITMNKIFSGSALSKLQQLTGTVLIISSDGQTVYIGAPRAEGVTTIKRKLATLARFYSLIPGDMTQVVKIFLFNEGERPVIAEYRYLADGNDALLRSYILDRVNWPHLNLRYPKIFQRGVILRLNPHNGPWEEAQSLSNTVLPIVKDRSVTDEFGAFRMDDWKYPAKEAVGSAVRSDTSTGQSGQNSSVYLSLPRPVIENWVFGLPAPQENRTRQNCQTYIPAHYNSIPSSTHSDGGPTKLGNTNASQSQKSRDNPIAPPAVDAQMLSLDITPSLLNGPRPTTGLKMDCCMDTLKSDEELADESVERTIDSISSPTGSPILSVAPGVADLNNSDPFQHLWREFRLNSTEPASSSKGVQGSNTNSQALLLNGTQQPRLTRFSEQLSRSFHVTMNQKAGSRRVPNNTFPEFDPNMMTSINESLTRLMAPLRMWSGVVDLGIELGRFCFLNVTKSHIQEPGDDDDKKHFKLDQIQNELNKRHKTDEKLYFTRVLTSLGADANYIAHMRDSSGNAVWKRPADGRSSVYEFICRSKTTGGEDFIFIVDIDAIKHTSRVKHFKPDKKWFAMHCTKRVWDFRVVLSTWQDPDGICVRFAEDLVRSLRVIPGNDRIPELEVSYDESYGIDVQAVRVRNIACCIGEASIASTFSTTTRPRKDVQRLYISEVCEMDRLSISVDVQRIRLHFARYKRDDERSGMPLVWYEAALQSDTLSTAFKQNEKLELGNEVEWVSEELLKSGVVEALIQKAADMIKNMDGVGYWNDNHQKEVLRKVLPVTKLAKGEDAKVFCKEHPRAHTYYINGPLYPRASRQSTSPEPSSPVHLASSRHQQVIEPDENDSRALKSKGTLLPRPARYLLTPPPWNGRGLGSILSSTNFHRLSWTKNRSPPPVARGLAIALPVGLGLFVPEPLVGIKVNWEEEVFVVQRAAQIHRPFRLSVDPLRAAFDTLITGVGYLLMLAVMTVNVGFFIAVLGGTFLGTLLVGRYYSAPGEH